MNHVPEWNSQKAAKAKKVKDNIFGSDNSLHTNLECGFVLRKVASIFHHLYFFYFHQLNVLNKIFFNYNSITNYNYFSLTSQFA